MVTKIIVKHAISMLITVQYTKTAELSVNYNIQSKTCCSKHSQGTNNIMQGTTLHVCLYILYIERRPTHSNYYIVVPHNSFIKHQGR